MNTHHYKLHPDSSSFGVGSKVICTKKVRFLDNTFHKEGEELIVTNDNISYFRLFTVVASEG